MSRKNNPFSGAAFLWAGFALIRRPGIRKYVITPLLLNVTLFGALLFFLLGPIGDFITHSVESLPEWLQWLNWLVYPVLVVAFALLVFYLFTLFANFVAAPFNGPLAEAVEYELLGKTQPETSWGEIISAIPASLKEEWLKFSYSAVRLVIIAPLLLIPGVNFVAAIVWAVLGAWLLAIQYLDYSMSNHGIKFKDQIENHKQRRWLVLGFGLAVMTVTVIPVLNLIVVPMAVAGASKLVIESFPELLVKSYNPTEDSSLAES